MFAANQNIWGNRKDSVTNAEQTGEFVWNMATYELRDAVNRSAQAVGPEVDEFALAGVTAAPSRLIKAPRVLESPIQFECVYHATLRLPAHGTVGTVDVVIGRVIGVHIADGALTEDGRVDVLKLRPIARLGYYDYTSIETVFQMIIPGNDQAVLAGLEGRPVRG
jgi:flavin reductase (DIM6/NTAB) family NADH-FMN oxidoreductase RutF